MGRNVKERNEGNGAYGISTLGVVILVDGLFLMAVVEGELWWEEARLRWALEEEERERMSWLERKEIEEREQFGKLMFHPPSPELALKYDSVGFENVTKDGGGETGKKSEEQNNKKDEKA